MGFDNHDYPQGRLQINNNLVGGLEYFDIQTNRPPEEWACLWCDAIIQIFEIRWVRQSLINLVLIGMQILCEYLQG